MNYDIIIIGSGVAGMTAAIYATRGGKSVLVLETTTPGGQILQTEHIANYPALPGISGKSLSQDIHNQAKALGAVFRFEQVVRIHHADPQSKYRWEITTDADNNYNTKALILATGTDYRHLNLAHEDELIGHGISFCATCDGALYRDQPIAVYGGGNSAFYSALYLSDIAEKVYLIHRRDSFRADTALIEQLKAKNNVEFILSANVEKLLYKDKLTGVELSNGQTLDISALFVSIGRQPYSDLITNSPDLHIELDKDGYIITDECCETSEPTIFAAGDCRSKVLRQIVTAVSDGAIAASSALQSL